MIPTTFRDQFAQLSPAEVIDVLGWIVEPGINSPVADVPDDLADAMQPITEAYQAAYKAMANVLDPDPRDRAADEADYRYEQWRDERDMREYDREQAA